MRRTMHGESLCRKACDWANLLVDNFRQEESMLFGNLGYKE